MAKTQQREPGRHVIRLRHPWIWQRDGADAEHSPLRGQRTFHRPTGLEAGVQVMLHIQQLPGIAAVWLNNQPLTGHQSSETDWLAEVTAALAQRNQLALELTPRSEPERQQARDLVAAGAVQLELVACRRDRPD